MHASATAFQILKLAGVAYLFFLACATWRDKAAFSVDRTSSDVSMNGLILRAFLLNILNPKLTIFFLAFLPQSIARDAVSPLLQLIVLSGVFMAITFGVFVIYGLLANAFRRASSIRPACKLG